MGRGHEVQHEHHHGARRSVSGSWDVGGQIEIRCVHAMVWHAPDQDLDSCTAVYKSVLQAEFVRINIKVNKLPPDNAVVPIMILFYQSMCYSGVRVPNPEQ